MTLGISIRWYSEETVVIAAPDGARAFAAFLCGPTTDARPEVAELLATSAPRVSLSIDDRCTASTRFWAQAHEAKLTPGTPLDDLTTALLTALRCLGRVHGPADCQS